MGDALEAVQRVADRATGPHHVVGGAQRVERGDVLADDRAADAGTGVAFAAPVAGSVEVRSATTAASKRSSRSATGSSTSVMPPTATGPGMTMTCSAP